MNFEIYKYIAGKLCNAIDKGYLAGIKNIAKLNKKMLSFSMKFDNPLYDISYTDTDRAMINNFKVEAFTVAGVLSYELEEKLKELAIDIQTGKHPLSKGEVDIKKLWKDEALSLLSDYIPVKDMPAPSYLNTNLQTAVNSAYHGSRWQRLQDPNIKGFYPAYQYKTRKDPKVRPEHRLLDDKIYFADDPVWLKIWPPNGWNCRCYVNPLTQEEIRESNSPVEPQTTSEERKKLLKDAGISKDFDRNSGDIRSIWGKWLDSELSDKDYSEITDNMKVYAGTNATKGFTVKQTTVDSKLSKDLMQINRVLNNPDQVWGDTYKRNGVINSEINYIKFIDDAFELVRVNNGVAYSYETHAMEKLKDVTKGVLMI